MLESELDDVRCPELLRADVLSLELDWVEVLGPVKMVEKVAEGGTTTVATVPDNVRRIVVNPLLFTLDSEVEG